MDNKAKQRRVQKYLSDPIEFARRYLWIRNKDGVKVKFQANPHQVKHYKAKKKAVREGKRPLFLVLKARRLGFTTWEQAQSYHMVCTNADHEVVTLAQDRENTEKIFRMCNTFYNNHRLPLSVKEQGIDPYSVRPARKTNNKKEINFHELNSIFYLGTAGTKSFGRGQTLNRVHGSEVAWWKGSLDDIDNLVIGLLEACSHGEVVFETTANGMGNWFYRAWRGAKNGTNDWIPLFYPWTEDRADCWIPLTKGEELKYTQEEEELATIYKLKPEQVKFRRMKIRQIGRKKFPQEYPMNDVEAFIASGVCFFDTEIVTDLVKYCKKPIEIRDDGRFRIWERPGMNEKYFIGADVGEGVPGGDPSCAKVLNYQMEEVASWHGVIKPEHFAKKIADIGLEYNKALIGVESNNHGHSTLNSLRNNLHYPNIYYMLEYDKRRQRTRKLGWHTNGKTRPIMLDELKKAIEENETMVNDPGTLEECKMFIDNGTGKYQAAKGEYDDRIFAHGIAIQIRGKPIKWIPDVEAATLDLGIDRMTVSESDRIAIDQ